MIVIVFALSLLATLIFWAAVVVAGLLFLRAVMTWSGANPFGRFSYNLTRLTEPLVRPLRSQFAGRYMRYDLMPVVMGVMVLVTGLFISSSLAQFAGILGETFETIVNGTPTARFLIRQLVITVGLFYIIAIFLRFFLPFFNLGYGNAFVRFIYAITEPLLRPLRRIFVAGMFDFSPLVAMLIIQVLVGIVASQLS